MTAKIQVLTF